MTADIWLSLGMGVGLGVLYGAAGYLTNRRAAGAGQRQFLKLVFGGMVVRIFAAVAILTVILVTVPVRAGVFALSFVAAVSVAIGLETWALHRSASASQGSG